MPSAMYKAREMHGMTGTSTYYVWYNMRNRCMNPKNPAYSRYGGRGIAMAPEWQSFMRFVEDMGERPDGMTLERRDNERGYSRDNCRWATYGEQANNTRSNRRIKVEGKTKTLAQWADETGINRGTLHDRLEAGMSAVTALTTPVGLNKRPLTLNGETLTITEWAKRLGTTQPRLSARLMRGWSIERTLTEPLHDVGTRALRAPKS